MTTGILVLLAFASVVVLFRAQAFGYQSLIYASKPLAMVSIGLIAVLAGPSVSGGYRVGIMVGLALSLIGDIFLMLPKDRFMAGLAAFLAAHLAYIHTFVGTVDTLPVLPFLPFVVASLFLTRLLWPHLGRARVPVLLYSGILALMAGSALGMAVTLGGTGPWLAALGAMLFVLSDAALAFDRFIRGDDGSIYIVWGTYFTAQCLIALSVLA
jgi:uncharacterized membrane protein YhhN